MEQDTSRVISVCVQTRHFNVSQQLKPISAHTNQCTDQSVYRPISVQTNQCTDQSVYRPISVQTNQWKDQSVYRPISVQTNQCTDQLNIMHKQIRNSEHYEGISG